MYIAPKGTRYGYRAAGYPVRISRRREPVMYIAPKGTRYLYRAEGYPLRISRRTRLHLHPSIEIMNNHRKKITHIVVSVPIQ